jgi:hypothetical protein
MRVEHQDPADYFMHPKGIAALWAGLLLAPLAWTLHLGIGSALVDWICESGRGMIYHLLTLATLLIAAGGFYLAWHSWRIAGPQWPDSGGDPVSRSRFMALSGLMLSGFFTLVIIAQWLPALFLDPCSK